MIMTWCLWSYFHLESSNSGWLIKSKSEMLSVTERVGLERNVSGNSAQRYRKRRLTLDGRSLFVRESSFTQNRLRSRMSLVIMQDATPLKKRHLSQRKRNFLKKRDKPHKFP